MSKTRKYGNVAEGLIGIENREKEEQQIKNNKILEKKRISKSGLKQRGYYMTDEQYREIKRLAYERLTDTSFIVREAVDEYIKAKSEQ